MCVCVCVCRVTKHTQVNRTEAGRKQGLPESLLQAEIMAHSGRYLEAARLYTQVRGWCMRVYVCVSLCLLVPTHALKQPH